MEKDFGGENPGGWQENGFGINKREKQNVHMKRQPKNEKYANNSVGARVRLMVRGGCLNNNNKCGLYTTYLRI